MAILFLTVFTFLISQRAQAQPRTFDVPSDVKYMGAAQCAELCHGKEQPAGNNWWRVRLTESHVWERADRHSEAYKVLTGERGRRMGRLLGQDVLAEETGCIQCHATRTQEQPHDLFFAVAEGVGCEACHGPSELWIKEHAFSEWLDRTPPRERTELGMNDVRDPIIRAEICSSCHIGDAERNRMITHEMYAAGHPLLTGFEIETFVNKMPRHWQYGYEKHNSPPHADPLERTRKLLVASVVTLRRAVELAAADASATSRGRWPELARMDCFACHHHLAQRSWRQARGYPGQTGRPALMLGNSELAVAAAGLVDSTTQVNLREAIAQLHMPFERSVFGDAGQLALISEQVIATCQQVERQLAEMPLDESKARKALLWIANTAAAGPHDYATARQLFGAFIVVYDELGKSGEDLTDTDYRDRLVRAVQSLRGQDRFLTEPPAPPGEFPPDGRKTMVEDLVPRLIANRAEYDPYIFNRQMAKIAEWLEGN